MSKIEWCLWIIGFVLFLTVIGSQLSEWVAWFIAIAAIGVVGWEYWQWRRQERALVELERLRKKCERAKRENWYGSVDRETCLDIGVAS